MIEPLLRHLRHEQGRLRDGLLTHPQPALRNAHVQPLPQDHLLLAQLGRREEVDGQHLLVRGHERQERGLVGVDDGGPGGSGVEDHAVGKAAAAATAGGQRVRGLGGDEGAEVAAGVAQDDGGAGAERGLPVEGEVDTCVEKKGDRNIDIQISSKRAQTLLP